MRKLIFISSLMLFPFAPIFGQKGKEKSMQEQALDDVEALSSLDYPYIELFHKAVREKMSGNFTEAKKQFKACLEKKQNDDAVYFGLGEIAKAESNVSVALENYQKAYAIDKSNTTYLQELAYMHFERANFEQAEILFKEMCEREPRNIDFRYGYSKVLIYNKAYQLAIDELNTLQNQTGVVPELMIMKADLYSELKEYDKTEETLLQLKNEFPTDKEVLKNLIAFYEQQNKKEKALQLIEELAENDPENGTALFVLASNYIEQEDLDKFLAIAPKILKNNQVETHQKLLVYDQLKKLKDKNDPMIIEAAEHLYFSYPENFEVTSRYTKVLLSTRQSKKALTVSRKAIKDSPNNFEAWKMALSIEANYSEYEALFEDANKALELFPNLPVIYFSAAEGALYSNHPDEAIQLLAAGEIYLLNNKKEESLFSMRKGEIYFYTKEYKKGIVAFEKAISYNPEDPKIQITYALALSQANIAQDVATELLEKVKEEERSGKYYLAKAQVALNANKLEDGIRLLEEGVEMVFNNAELLDLLGDFYFKNQNSQKALTTWKLAEEHESRNKVLGKKINEEQFYAPKYY